MKNIILLLGLFSTFHCFAEAFNLHIEYCPERSSSSCHRIYMKKVEKMLAEKGYELTDVPMPVQIVLQLKDSCSYVEICPLQNYNSVATMRLMDPITFQTHLERNVVKKTWPLGAKSLINKVMKEFPDYNQL